MTNRLKQIDSRKETDLFLHFFLFRLCISLDITKNLMIFITFRHVFNYALNCATEKKLLLVCRRKKGSTSLTKSGILGLVDKPIGAFPNDLQVSEDVNTALAPRSCLLLVKPLLAQPEGKNQDRFILQLKSMGGMYLIMKFF